jgi:glycerate dehydrogenase
LICVVATGTNNIDLQAAEQHGVRVVNCRDYATATVSQHVLGLILSLTRSLPDYNADVAHGAWQRSPFFCRLDHPIREIQDLSLGIIGYGTLGQATAELARAVGMTVHVAERADEPAPRTGRLAFEDVLQRSDVVSLHCPLTAATHQLIGPREIELIGAGGYLINTARGGLIDERAVADALYERRLAGAGLDVLSQEPPADNNPLLERPHRNLLITPHCAWGSQAARQRIVEQTAGNIRAFNTGNAERVVV